MTTPFRLDGKVALVTGAGSVGTGYGNGRATALVLARQGARVLAVDNREAAARETDALIQAEGGEADTHVADLTASAGAAGAVAACIARFGGLDIMVNNVGGSAPGSADDMPEEAWDAQIALNLRSAYLGCRHAVPALRARGGGAIVNLSSIAAYRMSAERPHIAYSAAKYGILALSRSIAMRHARENIRCNTVVPGLMHTPLVEHRLVPQLGAESAAALIAKRDAQVPLGKMGDAWDVAYAILFLVSAEARHVTGTELLVDGGMSAAMP